MSEINPNPEDLIRAKEKVCAEIMAADEFIVFVHAPLPESESEGEDAMGVQTIVSSSPANFPFFSHAFKRCEMTMAHSMLGEMLGLNDEDGEDADITSTWLFGDKSDDALPDPDTVEVPDFVPDFSDESWNTPGGEFPGKADA